MGMNDGKDWLIVTPNGLYDGSEGGCERVMFRVDLAQQKIEPAKSFPQYRRPGILAALLRTANGRRREK